MIRIDKTEREGERGDQMLKDKYHVQYSQIQQIYEIFVRFI